MTLQGKKILMVIAPENFRDEEFLRPRTVFEQRGAQVIVVSKGVSEARGALGESVTIDKDISSVSGEEFDAVVFVGGSGAEIYFDALEARQLAEEAHTSGKILGAICIAPSILANAGLLNGKRATSFSSEAENLEAKGAVYTDKPVVRDGRIVTGSGPQAAAEFAQTIAAVIAEQ